MEFNRRQDGSRQEDPELQLEPMERIDEITIREIFSEGSDEYTFFDNAPERYAELLNNYDLSIDEQTLILNVFWSLVRQFLNLSDEVQFPQSLKGKMLSDPIWLRDFIGFISSWTIDMDQIAEWKSKMSPEEEKFFWQIFHRKFDVRSNRDFEDFPRPYQEIIAEEIEKGLKERPDRPYRILDAGCGPKGNAIRQLKLKYKNRIEAYGINMEINTESDEADLVEGDVRNTPFGNNFFDLVYEVGVSGYFKDEEDLRKFILETTRILRAGGTFLFTDTEPKQGVLNELNVKYEIIKQAPLLLKKK